MPRFVMKYHLQGTSSSAVHGGHGDVSASRTTSFPTVSESQISPAGSECVETLATFPKAPSWEDSQGRETRQGSSSCCWRTVHSDQLAAHPLPSALPWNTSV